jgi:hypothetical protein
LRYFGYWPRIRPWRILPIGSISDLKTVANYHTDIRQKLDIHSPVELIRLTIKQGVIMKT